MSNDKSSIVKMQEQPNSEETWETDFKARDSLAAIQMATTYNLNGFPTDSCGLLTPM